MLSYEHDDESALSVMVAIYGTAFYLERLPTVIEVVTSQDKLPGV